MIRFIEVGDTIISLFYVCRITYNKPLVSFINVHQNEETSIDAAKMAVQNFGGEFWRLSSKDGGRLISFGLGDSFYVADPNRIFTSKGRLATLAENSPEHKADFFAENALELLAQQIVRFLIEASPRLVIAVHNNEGGNYSAESYVAGDLTVDCASAHINESIDPHDFVLTTNNHIFSLMQERDLNVILQDNDNVTDDGSLSVLLGKMDFPYVNVEAKTGHLPQQVAMLSMLLESLNLS